MAKSETTTSYRFDNDFIELLNTWSFITKRDKGDLLQDAFREYTKTTGAVDVAQKVNKVMKIIKPN